MWEPAGVWRELQVPRFRLVGMSVTVQRSWELTRMVTMPVTAAVEPEGEMVTENLSGCPC